LHRYYPQLLGLSPAADEPWLWELLCLAPTPDAARRLRPQRITALLKDHGIRRLNQEQVLAALRTPPLRVAPGTIEAATTHIALLLPRLQVSHEQRRRCKRLLEALLDQLAGEDAGDGDRGEHRDVEVL